MNDELKKLATLMAQLEEAKETNRHGLGEDHWTFCQALVASLIEANQDIDTLYEQVSHINLRHAKKDKLNIKIKNHE